MVTAAAVEAEEEDLSKPCFLLFSSHLIKPYLLVMTRGTRVRVISVKMQNPNRYGSVVFKNH